MGIHQMLFGAAIAAGFKVKNSVRLRAVASAYLSRTFGAPTNNKVYTFSTWCKHTDLVNAFQVVLSPPTSGFISFGGNAGNPNIIRFNDGGATDLITSQLFRDLSAHYHVILAVDTTQAIAADRVGIYVNGTKLTAFSTANYPALNASQNMNSAGTHTISRSANGFDGYLSDTHFVDGQVLPATAFGEFNASGVWVPKAYTGTYGSNGFYLKYEDASSVAALGLDSSGNANNWTPVNVSVTAGINYDSMVDTQTNNFATLNPLGGYDGGAAQEFKKANLTYSNGAASWASGGSTVSLKAGKFYFEGAAAVGASAQITAIGLRPLGTNIAAGEYCGSIAGSFGGAATSGGMTAYSGGTAGGNITGAYSVSTPAKVAVDFDAGKVWIGIGTQWIGGGDPAAGTTPTYSFAPNTELMPYFSSYALETDANFGQRPFTYTPPTGFKAICTENLQPPAAPKAGGTFTGNANADGPFVWIGGVPTTLTINGNVVTFGTHADKTAGGFKVRSAAAGYNVAGANTWVATFGSPSTRNAFAQPQPAQANP